MSAVGESLQLGRRREAPPRRRALRRRQLPALDRLGERAFDPPETPGRELRRHLAHHGLVAGPRRHLRDARTHQPSAQNPDLTDFHLRPRCSSGGGGGGAAPQNCESESRTSKRGPASAMSGVSGATDTQPWSFQYARLSRARPPSLNVERSAFRSAEPCARRLRRKSATAAARTGKSRIRSLQSSRHSESQAADSTTTAIPWPPPMQAPATP